MNWLGGSLLTLYFLGTFFVVPFTVLYSHFGNVNEYLPYLHEIISGFVILLYLLSQRMFNGVLEFICGIGAAISQLMSGFSTVQFLVNEHESLSMFEKVHLLCSLVFSFILIVGITAVIVGLFVLLFWGSAVWIIDQFRVDRYKEFRKEGNKAHVIITGGGTGLGKAAAILFAEMGVGHITVISRNISHLEKTKEIAMKRAKFPQKQHIHPLACDVTDLEMLKEKLTQHIEETGIPDLVICSAGASLPGYFLEVSQEVFYKQMNLNYMGCVNTVKAIAPLMLDRPAPSLFHRGFLKRSHPHKGEICLVSSALGVMGSIGYSMYCPTKYAVRGLAECLRQEFAPMGLNISCFYPSNMKTESFAIEMQTKPIEARKIDEQAATITPERGAEQLLRGLSRAQFHISTEWLIDGLRGLSNGISPTGTPVLEFFIIPATFVIGKVYRWYMDLICESEAAKKGTGKEKQKKEKGKEESHSEMKMKKKPE
ncbi:short chain dehydrogenase family protein [Monocercomonoides exilis]|uniref:short chain dehydrogenase family protein n=1 Tax=Monocercomonoides exilis TaxID=2049356 RepID=UPI0035594D83|nr:short chain dehydrogenase family protein [Monocercomonoides exilis]|eukprot:MONOS_4494.1-p1 / transcript=MONOS_4494.1 / gene=MONOS_4494 / organism=Monocercomonoides_exilis_PA203 / gene_product=short chain dehydrogenase family protein / transcript_product=short chain dehydrogenase family protein / location=Mono_scaffold00120:51042-52490(-) / protein_length=482 / sequence_SO=supercontig / SO=protein_coding / is_pseudo=false